MKETAEAAKKILRQVSAEPRSKATVAALYGDLGSGKTALVQEVGKLLGIKEPIQSPTFVIMKRFEILASSEPKRGQKDLRFKSLMHIDAYRLEQASELEKLGWKEIISNEENLIFIEWPERVGKILPSGTLKVYLKFLDEKTREISFGEE